MLYCYSVTRDQTQLLRTEADPRDDVIGVILGLDGLVLLLLWDPLCFFFFTSAAGWNPTSGKHSSVCFSVTVAVQGPEDGCCTMRRFLCICPVTFAASRNATRADSAAQVSLQNLTDNSSLRTEMPTVRELVSSCGGGEGSEAAALERLLARTLTDCELTDCRLLFGCFLRLPPVTVEVGHFPTIRPHFKPVSNF